MDEINKIALAAFLHDIGKFRQRTGKDDLSDFDLSFAMCDKQKCSYLHAAHTSKAIEEIGLGGIENLIQLAASHHKPNLNGDERVIQLADRYASSERKVGESSHFQKTKLMSIFSEVALCNENKEVYFPIQKFSSDIVYPDDNKEDSQAQKKYQNLYESFKKEAQSMQLNFNKNDNFLEFLKLKSLLEKYTTFIPSSSYNSYPDVSLFDHLLLTSALSVALKEDKESFYLIQGDFTSIQNFIFSQGGESNKFLAKILRAKSLFVSLATEYIALKICKLLQIPPTNIVLNAGGKFTIIAPKYKSIKVQSEEKSFDEFIKYIRYDINKQFAKINYLQTKFALTYIEEKYEHLQYNSEIFEKEKNLHCQKEPYNASCVFWKIAKSFEEEKLKFDSEIEVFDKYIDEFQEDKEKCDICGIVPTNKKINDIYICEYCNKFKEWGEKFTKKKYIKLDFSKDLMNAFEFVDDIQNDNKIYFSMNEKDNFAIKRVANYVPLIENGNDERYKLIEEKFDEKLKEGDVKSFYHIAVEGLEEKEDGFYGRKYLAILKADVDNLGQIFIYGFKKGKDEKDNKIVIPIKKVKNEKIYDEATFSRIMSLSRFTDFYFTSILKKKIKEKYKNIYTVFAGGDDLFLIGHYEEIIGLHKELVDDFKKFTRNKDLHLSFAVKLISPNVPITQMAEFAEEDLKKAKDFNKNNTVIFGIKVSNDEILKLYELENEFRKMDYLSESFLYKIYTFIDMKEKTDACINIIHNAKWKALFNYSLQKSITVKDKEEKEKNIQKAVVIGEWIEKWGEKLKIPLNLYLYSKRKYKKE